VPALPRLAYLTSLYPAASHTFILREVTELRALGFTVETCSIRFGERAYDESAHAAMVAERYPANPNGSPPVPTVFVTNP